MPQISTIKFKDVLEAHRFDAEYFKPEYLEIDKLLSRFDDVEKIKNISKIITNGHTPRHADLSLGEIKFLTAEHIGDFRIETQNTKFIKEEPHKKELKRTILKTNDLLVTIKGKIGNFAVVSFNTEDRFNINQDVGRIVLKKEYNPYYISGFLNSKFGKLQSKRVSTGQINPFLGLGNLITLKIPILNSNFQLQIEKIVKESHKKQEESKKLYKQAEELLLKEVGLLDYKIENTLAFETTKKEVSEAVRFDSEYFQPKYAEIIEKVEDYEGGFDVVKNIIDWKKGTEVGSDAYVENGKDFIRVSDFTSFGIVESSRKITKELFEEIKEKFQPKKGEILFTKDGTIGRSHVLKEDVEGVLSGAFLRLSLKEKYSSFKKECLCLMFNSIISRFQVEQLSGGAIIAHLKPSDFEKFKIPLINPGIQKQIAEKVKESHKLRKESKELLEEAKRKVEEEIEK